MNNDSPFYASTAEQGILGCILLTDQSAPGEVAKMLDALGEDDFHDLRHREVFTAMNCLVFENNPVDTTTVTQRLNDHGSIDQAGGYAYVSALTEMAPCSSHFDFFLPIIKDATRRRSIAATAAKLVAAAQDKAVDQQALSATLERAIKALSKTGAPRSEWLRFYSPSQLRAYRPPPGHLLVGDAHIKRGEVVVIGGPPGVGKSRALTSLAVAGATGDSWLGLPVHRKFKTMILQAENGLNRLATEFQKLDGALDSFIRICSPPPFGMAFSHPEFRATLRRAIAEFKPDIVAFDPWNSAARDDTQRDYLETFDAVRSVLPAGDAGPALVIAAHTRKPRDNERASGRALLNLLAGSHVLASVPRSVFVMQPASDAVDDDRVVWTCCKNNDGQLGERSAWHRRNGGFERCSTFDWKRFDAAPEKRRVVAFDDLHTLFDGGAKSLPRKEAVAALSTVTGLSKTACYDALKPDGKFSSHLRETNGLLGFAP